MLKNWGFRALIHEGRRTSESIIALRIAQQELEESGEGGRAPTQGLAVSLIWGDRVNMGWSRVRG